MTFEKIDNYRARAKILGGWLVETMLCVSDSSGDCSPKSIAICFVPDALHEWELEKEPNENFMLN